MLLMEGVSVNLTVAGSRKLFPRMLEWREGDLVCGGAESVMDAAVMYGLVLAGSLRPLGVRESAILVPNGNPADIKGLEDLTRDDVRVCISMQGSLEGLWEDIALRAGLFYGIRGRVQAVAEGSSDMLGILARREVDAAIGWESMALLAPEKIETIPIPHEWSCWRATSIGVTSWSGNIGLAEAFIHFLRSADGEGIWRKFGWQPIEAAKVEGR